MQSPALYPESVGFLLTYGAVGQAHFFFIRNGPRICVVETKLLSMESAPEVALLQVGDLERKAVRASIWSILEYGFGMGLRVVSSLVLTRLLVPAYFGEITLVSTLIAGITLVSDIGLAPSVIQSPRGDDRRFLDTAWTVQVIRGIVLWAIAVMLSWPLAKVYQDAHLLSLIPALALCTLISSFNNTSLLTLSRHMGVRRLFLIDGSTAVVALAVTVTWAYVRPSVWAIVVGQLISTTYRLFLSNVPSIALGSRNVFCWDKESVHSIVHLGRWILVATAFTFFATQSDRLILGRLISLSLFGVYGLAFQLSDVPRAIILALGNRVAYPFIAKLIHQPMAEFRLSFLRYRSFALLAGACLLTLMVTWGGDLVLHLYDQRYQDAAWMIPILALGLWQTLLYQTTFPVLLSLGKAHYNAFGNAAYCVAICTAIPLAFHAFGMVGAVIAVAAGDLPLYVAIQFGMARQGLAPWRQDLTLTATFLALVSGAHFLKHMLQ